MQVKEIVSGSNPTYRIFLKLSRGPGIKKHGLALLSGPKQVAETVRDFPGRCAGVVLPKRHRGIEEAAPETVPRYLLAPELFREIDVYGTGGALLLVRVDPLPAWRGNVWPSGCSLLVPFQDPANVGAVIRSAAAFGVSRVVVLKESAHPFHHRSIRVAGSALFRVPLYEGPSIAELTETTAPIITLSPSGRDVGSYAFPLVFGLLPGIEGPGIPPEQRHLVSLSIPMEPGIESLNAATATGIVLYLWKRWADNVIGN